MYVIVCADDRMGMSFNSRRQCSDQELCREICRICRGHTLWMRDYSKKLFQGDTGQAVIKTDMHYLLKAGEGDYCFVELDDITEYKDRIEGIYLCRWNRTYPADRYFHIPGKPEEWDVELYEEIRGKSHDRITIEFWRKRR